MSFRYTVTVTFTESAMADKWIEWMRSEHVAQVIEAGAQRAEVLTLDGYRARCEARYDFASRAAFDEYVADHAPRLRAEGLKHFPAECGVEYARSCGEVVISTARANSIE